MNVLDHCPFAKANGNTKANCDIKATGNFFMEPTTILIILAIFIVAVLYSSVGHGGASGYLAVMAFIGGDARGDAADGFGAERFCCVDRGVSVL